MSHRRIAATLALALLAACVKDVEPESSPAFVDYSVFDPSAGAIPLPNDLALLSAPTLPAGAQRELLLAFAAAGGWPNDLELPITIGFTRATISRSGATRSPPTLDLATVRPPGHPSGATVAVFRVDVFPPQVVGYDVAGQSQSGTTTTLRLRNPVSATGSRTWTPGAQYAVAVRGGPDGVQTTDGVIRPQPTMFLLLAGKDLSDPANQGLLPDPSRGAQLEQIRQNYLAVFQLVDSVFPSEELVNVQTFQIAEGTSVRVDSGAGVVPLPFDLLRTDADGTIINNPAFGPAAPGLDTLDGFSTTAMMLAPTSAPVDAATLTGASVFLFDLSGPTPTLVRDLAGAVAGGTPGEAVYVTQPPTINQACPPGATATSCASVIGLQPAVPAAVPGVGSFFLPPLEEDTDYAVVVTKDVQDANGDPLVRGAVGKMILDLASPVSVGGVSQLAASGVDDVTAAALETMRGQLAPVYAALPGGKTKADVAMAYTFKTQSTTGVSLGLSALPFSVEQGAGQAVFTPVAATDVTATYAALQGPEVDSFWSVTTTTLDAIDKTTGALRPDLATLTPAEIATLVTPIPAIVAVPNPANVPACPPPNDALRCARLVVFGHGLGGGHLQSMLFTNELARNGFLVAAIDFPLHGDRAWCATDAECNPGGTCDLFPGGAGQGDQNPPGVCSSGNLLDPATFTSVNSGQYFISANFFRIRDAFRQNLIDQSALALSVARPPAPFAPQPAANPLAAALLAKGMVVEPSQVFYEGISLGGIYGAQILATNPRFTRGVLSVGGGTLVDVFTQAPAFQAEVDALFLSLGIDRSQIGTDPAVAARYLQTLNVAKWILDPAESLVFAKHVSFDPLPNLLSPTPANQVPKDTFGMVANGDTVVPNPFNFLLFDNIGADVTVYSSASAPGNAVPHSFLRSEVTAQAQASDWLLDPAANYPGTSVVLP